MNESASTCREFAYDHLELKLFPDAVLRQVCNPVERFGRDMSRLMDEMLRFMRLQGGIGLAGPQVGILWRIFVAEIQGDTFRLANPEIRDWTGQSKMTEGCLSLPDVNVKVARHKDIAVLGYDALGNKREYRIGGLWAHVVQHEIDHLNGVLIEIAAFDTMLSPPEMGRAIHATVRREIGHADPYRAIKQRSTQEALRVMPEVRLRIERSTQPFSTAVRFAIAGNILDYALASLWNEDQLSQTLAKAESHPVDESQLARLKRAINRADTILLLADNAGETVFDRLLIERLSGKRIIYAVKQSPVINEATRQDAIEAGLEPWVELMDNGTDAPGTVLSRCSPTFREVFDQADLVFAKGQANFETLNEVDREVFLLTQIKCAVIARHYGYGVGDWLVTTPAALAKRLGACQGGLA